jgi:hypothetical protein
LMLRGYWTWSKEGQQQQQRPVLHKDTLQMEWRSQELQRNSSHCLLHQDSLMSCELINFIDFKLSRCSKCHLLPSGLFTGICSLNVNISEQSVCSIFIGEQVWSELSLLYSTVALWISHTVLSIVMISLFVFVSDITTVLRQSVRMCGICVYHINRTFHQTVPNFVPQKYLNN